MITVGVVSLGCSKNAVDTEIMLGYLKKADYEIVSDPKKAQIIIVNTCGFIESAKQESINTILELADLKKTGVCRLLVATGCLCQRYREELIRELPEVDLILGVNEYGSLTKALSTLLGTKYDGNDDLAPRVLTTPPYRAYLRIADGCDNNCTYCAIPLIRKGRNSVKMELVLDEAVRLIEAGVKEITVIAQDTSGYGVDIYGKPMLGELLGKLDMLGGFDWIRVLYTYPETVDEKLIDVMVNSKSILNYIDMPIQHINDTILKRMNRRGDRKHIERVIKLIRSASPDFIIRTTAMVGFPGEGENEFNELMSFLKDNPIDRLGAFCYSPEDGTPSALFEDQLEEDVKTRRYDALMRQQQAIGLMLNQRRVGSVVRVIYEGRDGENAYGRSYAEAPDVDGKVFFKADGLIPGEFVNVKLARAGLYDMWGELV